MKLRISISLTILCVLLGLGLFRLWPPASPAGGPLPALQGEGAINHLKKLGQYGSLQEAVRAARYSLYQESRQSAEWLANNPAQRLRARFAPDGLQVETGGDGGRWRRLGMKLRSAGYGERRMVVSAGQLMANDDRAEIHHKLRQSAIGDPQSTIPESRSAIIEWYH